MSQGLHTFTKVLSKTTLSKALPVAQQYGDQVKTMELYVCPDKGCKLKRQTPPWNGLITGENVLGKSTPLDGWNWHFHGLDMTFNFLLIRQNFDQFKLSLKPN